MRADAMTPNLSQEIERKAFETIEKLHDDLNLGRITNDQFAYGIDILWTALAGIAGDDFAVAIEMLGDMKANPETRCYLLNPAGAVARLTDQHNGRLEVALFKPGKSAVLQNHDLTDAPRPIDAARSKLLTIQRTLTERGGFTPI